MARITAEDCIVKIPNRFELVLIAGQRAREISGGSRLTVSKDNDKNPVLALREIAEETVSVDALRQHLVRGMQRVALPDDPSEMTDLMSADQQQWNHVEEQAVEADSADGEEGMRVADDIDMGLAQNAFSDDVEEN